MYADFFGNGQISELRLAEKAQDTSGRMEWDVLKQLF
jgi:hypothetical protein